MTAKEQLRGRVDGMSEDEAHQALVRLDGDNGRTSFDRLLDEAPIDDEPETLAQRRAVEEAREEFRRGEGIPLDDVIRELG